MRGAHIAALVLSLIAAGGCLEGEVQIQGTGSAEDGYGENADPGEVPDEQLPDDPFPDLECEGVACEEPTPSFSPRVARLTHRQWENSVRDLLRLPQRPGLSDNFLGDTLSVGNFDRVADSLRVTPGLWDDYREAAETLAEQVANDPEALARIVPEGAPVELQARRRAFVEGFGERAFRRPLTDAEIDQYLALMQRTSQLFGADSFERSVELALRAFLQSPHFLYRVETHDVAGADVVSLDGWERASRLSFALWNTMPDDRLLEAARSGALEDPDQLPQEVARMLDDPRAADVIQDFHAQLLGFNHFAEMSKAQERFPDFDEATAQAMQRELELYIEDVVFDSDGTYRQLMTSTHTYANADVAPLYGVQAPSADEFGRVELDSNRRKGLLTRAGFLALNATAYDPNPIHRGVFVGEHVLCIDIPPPPDNFTIPDGVEGDTNRERIDNATRECGGACHSVLINPPGFAFENYDAVGAWREQDGGVDVDASGKLTFDGAEQTWQGPSEFVDLVAESPQSHSCYVRHWFEYVNGRLPAEGDEPLLARLAQASYEGDKTIKELLAAMVTSKVFLQRSTVEEAAQ